MLPHYAQVVQGGTETQSLPVLLKLHAIKASLQADKSKPILKIWPRGTVFVLYATQPRRSSSHCQEPSTCYIARSR